MTDPFNMSAFTAKMLNPDDDTKREVLRDAVSEQMDSAMGEVAPRIWAVLYREMQKDPKNNIHLNAVLNSGLFALIGWLAACTPASSPDDVQDNDAVLREKILSNLDAAFANRSDENGKNMAFIAQNTGQLKLTEDACRDLGKVLTANSMIIKGVHQEIQNWRKEK